MKVIFMGTPQFAVPALESLLSSDHQVVAVFTREPKPQNRGLALLKSPIHQLAEQNDIPVYTPKSLRKEAGAAMVQEVDADVIVVAAYGLIIPQNILSAKKFGCINIHPSKLPKYRGAAPLQRVIINDEKESAVCIMQMDEGIDTGDILLQQNFPIEPDTSFEQLHNYCAKLGGELLIDVLDDLPNITPRKQADQGETYAHKLTKEEGQIDWQQESGKQIYAKIRGMNPWPGAYFLLGEKLIKILSANWVACEHEHNIGAVISKKFEVACHGGILTLTQVQPQGKKAMSGHDFLLGNNVKLL